MKCDIANDYEVQNLVEEIPHIDVVVFLADTGPHSPIERLGEDAIREAIYAKLLGSALMVKRLYKRTVSKHGPIRLLWYTGKPEGKPAHFLLYSMLNSGIVGFARDLAVNYANEFSPSIIITPLIPTTLGEAYSEEFGAIPHHSIDDVLRVIERELTQNDVVSVVVSDFDQETTP